MTAAARYPRPIVGIFLLVGLLAGCGSRVSAGEVLAGAGRVPVELRLPPGLAAAPAQAQPRASAGRARTEPRQPAQVERITSPTRPNPPGVRAPAGRGDVVTRQPAASIPATAGSRGSTCPRALSPVAIGQIGTFSGVAGPITAGTRSAMSLWATQVNARGGVACHPVRLYQVDDAGDPARASAAIKDLVANRKVVALVGSSVTFSVSGFRPQIEALKIPAVGGDLLTTDWHASPYMFPQASSVDDQIIGIARAGVAAGYKKLGLLYCVELGVCGYIAAKLKSDEARKTGATLVYDAPITVTQTDYTAQCLNARKAGVDILGVGADGATMGRVARSCAAIGFRPILAIGAGAFSLEQTEDPLVRRFGVVTESPVVPWMTEDAAGMQALRESIRRYAPTLIPDGQFMLGWTSGKLFEAAVAKLAADERAGDLTSGLILEGLGSIRNETLDGLTTAITFTPGQTRASSSGCIYVARLSLGGWAAPNGSKPLCN